MTPMQKTLSLQTEESPISDLSALAFMQNPIATLILDENAAILKTNLAFEELSGYEEIDLLGKHISLFKSNRNEPSLHDACYLNTVQLVRYDSREEYILCKNDTHILVRKNSKNITSNGRQYGILTLEDITEQQKTLEHYQYLATHDSLTGLANRALLDDNFKKAQDRAIKNHRKMVLLVCDINGFKQLNDSCGHDFGDSALKEVAKTLEKLLRGNDTVARYGGDEFVLILEDIIVAHDNQTSRIVAKIKAAFPITIMNGEQACQINMCIGSACFPDEGSSLNQLIQIADHNMYQEKKRFYGFLEN